jgi:hypothetical protein
MDLKKNHLHLGETVLYNGTPVTVESITLIESTTLDGTEVTAVPWIAKEFFTVTLSNGKWAYGSQLEQEK